MKQTVRIYSNYQETTLAARTTIGGREMVLTEDFFLVTADTFETKPEFKGKQLQNQEFTVQRPYYEYSYDTNDLPLPDKPTKAPFDGLYEWQQAQEANDLNTRKRNATREFWAKHRQIKHKTNFRNGFVPDLPPVAYIEITSQVELDQHLKDIKRVAVFNKLMSMSIQETMDVALFYAPWLFGKTLSQMRFGLIGLGYIGTPDAHRGGALFQGAVMDDFLNNYDPNNSTVSMKIYVSKAVAMGIIVPTNGGYMLSNGTFVGKDIDSAVVYFTSDMMAYTNIIQPEVNAKSDLPENDIEDYLKEFKPLPANKTDRSVIQESKNSQYYDDIPRVRAEYEKLGGKGANGYNEMKAFIASKSVEVSKQKEADTQPVNALNLAINPEDTTDLNELKQIAKDLDIKGWAMYQNADKLREKIKEVKAETAKV